MISQPSTDKFSIVDVRCKNRKDRCFIVEMQMAHALKATDVPTEITVKITGLSAAEIEAL